MREFCYDKNNTKLDIKLDNDIVEKYIQAYEAVSGKYLNKNYINYEKIIRTRKDQVRFETKRADNLLVTLTCYSNNIELNLMMEMPEGLNDDQTVYNILTALNQYNEHKTYFIFLKDLTLEAKMIEKESKKIRRIINEKISAAREGKLMADLLQNYSLS